jgi:hypothetical protein
MEDVGNAQSKTENDTQNSEPMQVVSQRSRVWTAHSVQTQLFPHHCPYIEKFLDLNSSARVIVY